MMVRFGIISRSNQNVFEAWFTSFFTLFHWGFVSSPGEIAKNIYFLAPRVLCYDNQGVSIFLQCVLSQKSIGEIVATTGWLSNFVLTSC